MRAVALSAISCSRFSLSRRARSTSAPCPSSWNWTIAVPGGSQAITLPSLASFPEGALPPGPIVIGVTGGRVNNFDYKKLLYRQMRPQGMAAYSLDYFNAHL